MNEDWGGRDNMALMSNLTAIAIVGGFGLSRSSSWRKGGYFEP